MGWSAERFRPACSMAGVVGASARHVNRALHESVELIDEAVRLYMIAIVRREEGPKGQGHLGPVTFKLQRRTHSQPCFAAPDFGPGSAISPQPDRMVN
jgi:hypothetical protein